MSDSAQRIESTQSRRFYNLITLFAINFLSLQLAVPYAGLRKVDSFRVPMPGLRRANSTDRAVALRVRALRLARGMTQSELGRRLGVSFQQVQKYENGTNRIGAGRLQRITEIFDVPLAALFDAPRRRRQGAADPLAMLHTAGAVRLLQAYGGIRSATVRRALVRLAEETAARCP